MLTKHVPSEMLADEHYADQRLELTGWALVDAERQAQGIPAHYGGAPAASGSLGAPCDRAAREQ